MVNAVYANDDHMNRKTDSLIGLFFLFSSFTQAQNAETVPFDSLHWNIQAKEIKTEAYQGLQCINMLDGAAYLKDQFENGIVEFDISFGKERCFPGLMFRVADPKNFEFLYLRPHHSGDPDAIQYCPIVYGNDSWQLYTGEGFGARKDFAVNAWIHVKVIISGERAELYLNHEPIPTLYMYQLQRKPAAGGLGLDNHSPVAVRFANFSYSKIGQSTVAFGSGKFPSAGGGNGEAVAGLQSVQRKNPGRSGHPDK